MNVLNSDYFGLVSNFGKVTVHQENHVYLQEIPLKRRMLVILRNWELKKFLNYLQLNCLILIPSWPAFRDHYIVIFMNFYID